MLAYRPSGTAPDSTHVQQLDFEAQVRVWRHRAAGAARTIRGVGRANQDGFAADGDMLQAFRPARNYLAQTERRRAAMVRAVELGAGGDQGSAVVYGDGVVRGWLGASTLDDVLDSHARRQDLDLPGQRRRHWCAGGKIGRDAGRGGRARKGRGHERREKDGKRPHLWLPPQRVRP